MSGKTTERCTIIVSPRDRFSTAESCLETLVANTPEPYDLIIVMGGAPQALRERLQARFAGKAKLIFIPQFLNCAQARNIGLREAKTRLSLCMDSDVFVRPGWLSALIRCQEETGAGLVVPLMLENQHAIHTAGNSFFITQKGGKPFGSKVLPYHGQEVHEGTNIKRAPADYGEMHCQLVDTKAALDLGVYDERIREGEELDSGLTWKKGGKSIWFEPESIVVFDFPTSIDSAEDISLFIWRWDFHGIMEGYKVFHEKWGIDITENGAFKHFLLMLNELVGILPRLWPSQTALRIDHALNRGGEILGLPIKAWRHLRAWRWGYYDWVRELEGGPSPARAFKEKARGILRT